jgi:hypothetical protein
MRVRQLVLPALAAAVLAGCGSGSATPTAQPSASGTAVSPPAAASSAPPSPTASAASAEPSASASAQIPYLVLEPDGLGLGSGASIRQLRFGEAGADAVRAALAATLGEPAEDALPECGQGERASLGRDGFSVLLADDVLVGWTDQGHEGRTLTTADGLGIGSTVKEIRAARSDVTVSEGSLGPEFLDGAGFGGILDGTKGSSKATLVWAGETCFFR